MLLLWLGKVEQRLLNVDVFSKMNNCDNISKNSKMEICLTNKNFSVSLEEKN